MKTLLVLLLLVIVLSTGAYFVLRSPSDSGTHAAVIEDVDGADDTVAGAALDGASDELVDDVAEEKEQDRTPLLEDGKPEWTRDALVQTNSGRVLLPAGVPADEELTVRVSPKGSADASEETWDSYSVPVEEDGSFEYAQPGAAVQCELELVARYLMALGPLIVEPGDSRENEPTFEPRLGAWITGNVTLPEGDLPEDQTWEGSEAKVGLDFEAGIDRASAMAAESFTRRAELVSPGRFDFYGFPPTGFGLEVELERYPHVMMGSLTASAGEHVVLDIALEQGTSISGRVVDESGKPIDNARIVGVPGEETDIFAARMARSARSTEDGTWSMTGFPAGLVRVDVTCDGYLPPSALRLELVQGQDQTELEIQMSAGASIAGTVRLPDGTPADDAEVSLRFDPAALNGMNARNADRGATGEDRTNGFGHFKISGLARGPFQVEAQVHATEDGPGLYCSIAGVKPGQMELELQLHEVVPLRGRVVDPAGDPVTEFRVDLRAASLGGLISGDEMRRTFEDPNGEFEIDGVRDGSWNLYVRSEGFGAAGPLDADRPGNGEEEFLITMTRAVTVRGHVVTPNGDPAPGAVVTWTQDARDAILNMVGAAPSISGTAAEDGSFELTELPVGDLALETSSTDWASADTVHLTLADGELREDVQIMLRAGGTITGEFLQKDGEPGEGAIIQIQRTGGSDQHIERTDAEGAFAVEHLEPGKWQVIAVPPNTDLSGDPGALMQSLKMDMVELADGEVVHVVLGAQPGNPVIVTGQVTPGEPVAGAMVILIPEGEGVLGSMKVGTVDENGRFEVTVDRPGTYVVTVKSTTAGSGEDNVEFVETIPEGETHHMELRLPKGTISGRVTDSAGRGLGGVRVSLYTDGATSTGTITGGKYTEARTESDGSYTLQHLTASSYTVGAGGRPLTSVFDDESVHGRKVREHVIVEAGATVEGIDFRLESAGSITGRVVDSNGTPLEGASVFVRDERGALLERISLNSSGNDGRFTCDGVAPGEYTVSARTDQLANAVDRAVRVRSNQAADADLVLDAATMLRITCVDGENEPIIAAIEVHDSAGRNQGGQIGLTELSRMFSEPFSTTTRNIGPLPPGKYTVIATVDGKTVTKPVTLKGQESRKLRVRIK